MKSRRPAASSETFRLFKPQFCVFKASDFCFLLCMWTWIAARLSHFTALICGWTMFYHRASSPPHLDHYSRDYHVGDLLHNGEENPISWWPRCTTTCPQTVHGRSRNIRLEDRSTVCLLNLSEDNPGASESEDRSTVFFIVSFYSERINRINSFRLFWV